jgi:hypothetical protein
MRSAFARVVKLVMARALVLAIALAVVASCSASRVVDADARWAPVRSSFAAMGMAEIGEAHRGVLARGAEARIVVALETECVTVVAIGGERARDVDVSLVDARGRVVARDATHEAQATLRACVDAGEHAIVVRMAGEGAYVASVWSGGGVATTASADAAAPVARATGACDAPWPLAAGTVAGDTSHGASLFGGSCGRGDAKEIVYALRATTRTHLRAAVSAQFDTILYLRKDKCDDDAAEVACNDDAPGGGSAIDVYVEPGTYFLFVDALGKSEGAYRLVTEIAAVPAIADVCRAARALTIGSSVNGTTVGAYDNAASTCGDGAPGLDVPFKLDVPQRSRVRVVQHSDDVRPVVHVRRVCADEASEVGCSDRGESSEEAAFVGVLDGGPHTVFADAFTRDGAGRFTLRAEIAPERGSGVSGDTCSDAMPLTPPDKPSGDTFLARDDVTGSCSPPGAPDVVYRVDVARRTRFSARIDSEEGRHVLVLSRACGDRSAELACAARIDDTIDPGVYFLAVDGATPTSFGRFTLEVRARDAGAQEAACKSPATLTPGKPVHGSTSGAGDKFTTGCGGREDLPGAPDRVYRIVLAARARVELTLATPTWDGVLSLRRACVDGSASVRANELRCNNDAADQHHSRIDMTLEAGTYFVVVDGHAQGEEGAFTLEYKSK